MKNYWLKSGFYSLLNQLTQMVFNLGSYVILLRILDKPSCSIWEIYMTITVFIEVGRTGLLQNGLMTFLNQTPQSEHAKINKASLFLNFSLSVFIVILLLLLLLTEQKKGWNLMIFYARATRGLRRVGQGAARPSFLLAERTR